MGLDSVELLLAVEETFDVSMADEEVATVATVGDLQALVLGKVEAVKNTPCLTAHVFYRLRRALLNLYDVPRIELTPARPLASSIPEKHRRAHWASLSASVNLTLPALRRPRGLVLALNGVFSLVGISVVVAGAAGALTTGMCLALLAGGASLWWLAYRLTRPLAVHVPDLRTLGDLARAVFYTNTSALATNRRAWSAPLVWEVLNGLLVEQLGVDPARITPDARLVDDLGLD